MTADRRYSAFISYSHRDAAAARRLQRALESYRLPRALRAAASPAVDPRTGRLLPVFRDRDELTAAPDLAAVVQDAIAGSHALIVVCTPDAARSAWVAREVALAQASARPVLAALFAGDSATAFPPGLVTQGPDGDRHGPLAADFRPGGDGVRLARLKLVAALAGVGLDALVQRDAQRRLRRLVLTAAAAALVLAAIAVAVTLALVARADAGREQARGVATVQALVDQRAHFTTAGRLDLLQALDRSALAFFRDRDVAALPVKAQLLSAKLLQGVSEDDEAAGDLNGLAEAAAAAWRTTRRLLDAAPRDEERMMAHAQSEYWVGLSGWRRGDMAAARRGWTGYAALAEQLAERAPRDANRQREAGDADSSLATLALRIGDLAAAGTGFGKAQRRFEAAARLAPDDHDVQTDLADGHGWLADIERLNNRLPAALAQRIEQRRLLLAMRARDPDDAAVEASLTKNQLGLARIAALQGRWADADRLFDEGRAAALARARVDRANADIARQARAFDLFQVRAWLAMPQAQQPPLKRMRAVLGDCAAERRRAHNEEAMLICTASEAQLLALNGDVAQAKVLLTGMHCTPGYSERWHLNLCDVRANAIRAIGALGKQGEVK